MAEPVRDAKTAVDHLLDVVVYAPLGLLLNLDELLPQLVEKGHQQVDMARMFGKFAVKTGSEEARKRLGDVGRAHAQPAAAPTTAPRSPTPAAASAPARARSTRPPPADGPDAATLGISDYDALSASQVVPRLGGLAGAELEAVRQYETANRGRKTILSKIAQLQA